MSDDEVFRGVELRVHGIGDHEAYSAIGSPPIVDPPAVDTTGVGTTEVGTTGAPASGKSKPNPRAPITAKLPPLPRHPLLFLNWSRTSRKLARILWYLALPFSLVNVAGHMIPSRKPGTRAPVRWLAGVVIATSLLVTMVAFLWAVAIGETVLRMLQVGSLPNAGFVLVVSLAVASGAAVLIRGIYLGVTRGSSYEALASGRRPATSAGTNWAIAIWLMLAHVVVIAFTAVFVLLVRPSYLPIPAWLNGIRIVMSPRPFSEAEWTAECERLDAQGFECPEQMYHHDLLNSLNVVVVVSTALVVAVSLLMLIASFRRRYRNLGGLALALAASILLLHAFGSAIRVGISWALEYLDNFEFLSAINEEQGLKWSDRYFQAFQPDYRDLFATLYDTVPFLAALALVALLIAIAIVNALVPGGPRFTQLFRGKTRRMRYIHRTITELGPRLGASFVLGVVVWGLMLYWVVSTIAETEQSRFDIAVLDLLVVGTNVIAIVSVLFVVTGGRIQLLHRTFAIVADIVGFWSVVWHPLGGRTYRQVVVDGLSEEVDKVLQKSERLVLVGHSQGSVLSVWYLAHRAPRAQAVRLITCGSPVSSLYATFFPRFFDADVLASAHGNVTEWENFWRNTDPIATPLQPLLGAAAQVTITDEELPDPRDRCDASTPLGHSDYWNEPELKAVSEPWLAPLPQPTAAAVVGEGTTA